MLASKLRLFRRFPLNHLRPWQHRTPTKVGAARRQLLRTDPPSAPERDYCRVHGKSTKLDCWEMLQDCSRLVSRFLLQRRIAFCGRASVRKSALARRSHGWLAMARAIRRRPAPDDPLPALVAPLVFSNPRLGQEIMSSPASRDFLSDRLLVSRRGMTMKLLRPRDRNS